MQAPTRTHDYLYDTTYTVANQSDHYKALSKATQRNVVVHPVQANLFSSLPHYPSKQFSLVTSRISSILGNDRRNYFRGAPGDPPALATGTNRYRYFKRPLIPYTPSLGANVVYSKKPAVAGEENIKGRQKAPLVKTVSVQTQYRDSSVQTTPYSPEYTVTSQTVPELLALASLSYQNGLPVGAVEIEMIERARVKRAWEQSLPVVTDQESFEKRLRMMEEMELTEWRQRDDEIRRIQDIRLKVLANVIRKREAENECINADRVEKIWQRKLQERDHFLENTQKKKIKSLRKLNEKRQKIIAESSKRDIIREYADFSSKIYAPKLRDGAQVERVHGKLRIQIDELNEYVEVEKLEAQIPDYLLNARADRTAEQSISNYASPARRVKQQMQQQLDLLDSRLKYRKTVMESSNSSLRFAQKIQKPPKRPETPVNIPKPEVEITRATSAVVIQKIIRGRVNQILMYQGKERRKELISELRVRQMHKAAMSSIDNYQEDFFKSLNEAAQGDASAVEENEVNAPIITAAGTEIVYSEEAVSGAGSQEFEYPDLSPVTERQEVLEPLQSEYTARSVDFLTKELVRLRQEQAISAVVKMAERTRRMREAVETGRRKQEQDRREIEDLVFSQLMSTQSQSVDSYLEQVLESCVDVTSATQARVKVRDYAEKINSIVDSLENTEENRNSTISDLVSSFLVPEVDRHTVREKLRINEDRYLYAAHQTMHDATTDIEK